MTEPGARASRVQEGCRSSQRFHPQPLLPPPAAARSPWPPRVAGPAKRKRTASLGRDFTSRVLCGAFLATLVRLSSSDLSACCTSDNKQALGRHNVCVCVRSKKLPPIVHLRLCSARCQSPRCNWMHPSHKFLQVVRTARDIFSIQVLSLIGGVRGSAEDRLILTLTY